MKRIVKQLLVAATLLAGACMPAVVVQAQTKTDTLVADYEKATGKQRTEIANTIFKLLDEEEVTDSLIQLTATAHKDTVAAQLYYWVGEEKLFGQDFTRASTYFNKAMPCIGKKNPALKADCLNELSICYTRLGLFSQALEAAAACLEVSEQLGDKERQMVATNVLGSIYVMAKQPAEAEKHLLRSLKLAQELNDSIKIAVRYGTLSELYHNLNNDEKAVDYARRGLQLDSLRGDQMRMAVRRVQMASPLFALGRIDEAGRLLREARPVLEASRNMVSLAICLDQLGYVNLRQGNTTEAVKCFEQVVSIYERTGERFGESKAQWGLWEALRHSDMSRAASHLERYATLKDTLYKQDVARMTADYDARYQNNELRLLNEQERQKSKMLLIIGSAAVLILIVGIIVQAYIARLKKKNTKMKKQLDQVRDQLLTPADRDFLHRVDELLEQQFRDMNVDLEQLASALCITRSQLNRKMKTLLDQSMRDHVNQVRTERAKRLLESGDMTISEVARACGIEDVAYFSRLFRKLTDMSPSEWKTKHTSASSADQSS